MTKREREQLERLMAKKQEEEAHDHDFFAEVRRRRTEVLRVLDVDAEAAQVVQRRAAEAGISMGQLCSAISRINPEWLRQQRG